MGFHLATWAYECATGISAKAQAVLAYLCLKADDKGERKCYLSGSRIAAATHLGRTSVFAAINELEERGLIHRKSGGRKTGKGGYSQANEYVITLPAETKVQPPPGGEAPTVMSNVARTMPNVARQMEAACRTWDATPPVPPAPQPQPAPRSGQAHAPLGSMFETLVGTMMAEGDRASQEQLDCTGRLCRSVVGEAMRAASVSDRENCKIFSQTILHRDPEACLEVIEQFASECRNGENTRLGNRAAVLNRRLSALPRVY